MRDIRRSLVRTLAAVVLLQLLQPAFLLAQSGKAELAGVVTDPSALPVSDARILVTLEQTQLTFEAVSDKIGEYHVLGLPAGHYVLTAQHAGFRDYHRSGITLRIADRTTADIELQIGNSSQSVNVNEATSQLETVTGAVSFWADQTKVEMLPLDGRNFIPLVALSPGVALPGGGSLLPRINGSRPRTDEYIYDGISALQPEPGQVVFYPVIDAIAEFRVNINSYSPKYGRSNGGTVLVSMRSGTNELHGTLFEFSRNEALNGTNYFASAVAKPEFR